MINITEIILIMGMFFGTSSKLNLRKEKIIICTTIFNILVLYLTQYLTVTTLVNKSFSTDGLLQTYLLISSGVIVSILIVKLSSYLIKAEKTVQDKNYEQFSFFEFELLLSVTTIYFFIKGSIVTKYINNFHNTPTITYLTTTLLGLLIVFVYQKIHKQNKYPVLLIGIIMIINLSYLL